MIPKKLQEIISFINSFDDQAERINILIEYADKFKPVPEEIAAKPYASDHKVEFCESGAYVWTKKNPDGTFDFFFAVENPHGVSAKALCAIFEESLKGETSENILSVNNDVVFKIFGQSLSMGKNLGLTGILLMMQRQIKELINS